MKNEFNLERAWNDILSAQKITKPEPRNHIWASEIGMPLYDRYMKMTGVEPTNPPDGRGLRKFKIGNLIEDALVADLEEIGLVHSTQERLEIPETETTLAVSGKPDIVLEVKDWGVIVNTAEKKVKDARENLSNDKDSIRELEKREAILASIKLLKKLYPKGIEKKIIEVKSVNSQLFWAKKDYLNEAYPHHIFQLYTYLKAHNCPEGSILYVSKDDMVIKEMPVRLDDGYVKLAWQEDVKGITEAIKNKEVPGKPLDVVYNPRKNFYFVKDKVRHKVAGCFVPNWQVEWSDYFTMITGCEKVEEWHEKIKPAMKAANEKVKAKFIKDNNL